MSGKHCCLPVDIYALHKTQRKALQILKTDLSLIRNYYGKVLLQKKKEQMFRLIRVL